ncbi:MAG: prepilin-type N-terminal cleavage/methylation domain-containing protein [Clostridiales bacterium]|nr:prepilin-type N-terminal cleavage/methylation domain-containing protein [Clostridiales bacterium]
MRIRKGYTFIELLMVLCIISILFLIMTKGIKGYKRLENDIVVEQCSNSIMTFIYSCREYCYLNKVEGYILCDQVSNTFSFYTGSSRKQILRLPQGFELDLLNTASQNQRINIDYKGFTSDACTIKYFDLYGIEHKLTISVGTAYVEIKN